MAKLGNFRLRRKNPLGFQLKISPFYFEPEIESE